MYEIFESNFHLQEINFLKNLTQIHVDLLLAEKLGISQTTFEHVLRFLRKISQKYSETENKKTKKCIYCNTQNSIKSHVISKNCLKDISISQKIFIFNTYWQALHLSLKIYLDNDIEINNPENKLFSERSIGNASVFSGFCATHDANIFSLLDNGSTNFLQEKTFIFWQYLYRTASWNLLQLKSMKAIEEEITEFMKSNYNFSIVWKILFKNSPSHVLNSYQCLKEQKKRIINITNKIEDLCSQIREIKKCLIEVNGHFQLQEKKFKKYKVVYQEISKKDVVYVASNYNEGKLTAVVPIIHKNIQGNETTKYYYLNIYHTQIVTAKNKKTRTLNPRQIHSLLLDEADITLNTMIGNFPNTYTFSEAEENIYNHVFQFKQKHHVKYY